jgi:hypothetical protein
MRHIPTLTDGCLNVLTGTALTRDLKIGLLPGV